MASATRQDYFARALRILADEGRGGLKIGRLCAALGVTSGSFYHHFGSWDAFVAALLEYWQAEEVGRIVELVNSRTDPAERMVTLKHLVLTVPHDAERAIRAWAGVDAVVAAAQQRVDLERRDALHDVLAALVPDPDVCAALSALGMSVLVGYQQLAVCPAGAPLGVELHVLFDQFELLILAHATAQWNPQPSPAPEPGSFLTAATASRLRGTGER